MRKVLILAGVAVILFFLTLAPKATAAPQAAITPVPATTITLVRKSTVQMLQGTLPVGSQGVKFVVPSKGMVWLQSAIIGASPVTVSGYKVTSGVRSSDGATVITPTVTSVTTAAGSVVLTITIPTPLERTIDWTLWIKSQAEAPVSSTSLTVTPSSGLAGTQISVVQTITTTAAGYVSGTMSLMSLNEPFFQELGGPMVAKYTKGVTAQGTAGTYVAMGTANGITVRKNFVITAITPVAPTVINLTSSAAVQTLTGSLPIGSQGLTIVAPFKGTVRLLVGGVVGASPIKSSGTYSVAMSLRSDGATLLTPKMTQKAVVAGEKVVVLSLTSGRPFKTDWTLFIWFEREATVTGLNLVVSPTSGVAGTVVKIALTMTLSTPGYISGIINFPETPTGWTGTKLTTAIWQEKTAAGTYVVTAQATAGGTAGNYTAGAWVNGVTSAKKTFNLQLAPTTITLVSSPNVQTLIGSVPPWSQGLIIVAPKPGTVTFVSGVIGVSPLDITGGTYSIRQAYRADGVTTISPLVTSKTVVAGEKVMVFGWTAKQFQTDWVLFGIQFTPAAAP